MIYRIVVFVLSLAVLWATFGLVPTGGHDDDATLQLMLRAGRTPELSSARGAGTPDAGPGSQLFYFTADDNAECVRSVPDVTGDGLDEIVVGLGWFQNNENLYCLDGSSTGAATVVWKLETMAGLSGGYFYGDQCLVPISDVDANGYANLLAGTAGGGRTAYNFDALDGSSIWMYDLYTTGSAGWIYSLCELNDITGDTVPEAAFGAGSDSDSVYLVDGSSTGAPATVLWQYHAGDAVYSVRSIGDVNNDGAFDVLAAVGDNIDKIVCLDGGTTSPTGQELWDYAPGTSIYACGVMQDITQDAVREALAVLWTSDGSAVRCLDGATGALIWSSTEVGSYGMAVDTLFDVTGDEISDVVVASWENAVTVLDGTDGTLVWKTVVGTLNGGDVWTARSIDDLNGDGRQDVIAGSFDYYVYAMDGDSGEVFWAFDTGNRLYSVYPVGDLNNDGRPEVVAGTQDTNNNILVHVLEGDAGIPWPGLTLTSTGVLGSDLEIEITGYAGWTALPLVSQATGTVPVPPFGDMGLAQPVRLLPRGPIPVDGAYVLSTTIPNNPAFSGRTFYLQGLVYNTPPLEGSFTDVESLDIL